MKRRRNDSEEFDEEMQLSEYEDDSYEDDDYEDDYEEVKEYNLSNRKCRLSGLFRVRTTTPK